MEVKMTKHTERLEIVDINRLVPYAKNARTHSDKQIKQLQASIREFGFINPVLIDGQYNIIAGHGRVLAATEEGLKELPCVYVDHLSKTQIKAYIIADNQLAMNASWDEELLKVDLEELKELNFDIDLLGFDDKELNKLFDGDISEDDFDVDAELGNPPITKLGDSWQLGRHRLVCGDSTSQDNVSNLMRGGPSRFNCDRPSVQCRL